jgi:P-type E1-E2 ATPase
MLPLVAAALGGVAVAAGTQVYQRIKSFGDRFNPAMAPGAVPPGGRQHRKLTVRISQSVAKVEEGIHVLTHEVHVVAVSVIEEAHAIVHDLKENELKPLKEAVGEEWRAFSEVVAEDEGLIADGARAAAQVIDLATGGAARTGRKIPGTKKTPGKKKAQRSVPLTPKAAWGAMKQAKELVFDPTRTRQMEEMTPNQSAARAQIAYVESICDRYLRVSVSSVATAAVGMTLLPPLKFVSAGLILYSCFPVFKNAYQDIVHRRKITIPLLDSLSIAGLLVGGYFLICSITSTVYHISMKMMLKTEDRSRQILGDLFGQQPRSVIVLLDGAEVEIPFDHLRVGDVLVVHAGQMIPIDGLVLAGTAAIDQHVLTGEAQPAEKGPGDRVFAATMQLAGRIEVKVEKAGSETAAAQIRELLANTTDFRSAVQMRWREVADKTVLPTLGLASVGALALGPLSGLAVINSNYVAVMRVSSPLTMLTFLQRASQRGILVKDGRALEAAGKVDTVVFDKTGTLTETQPHVGQIHTCGKIDAHDLLTCAAAVEANQSHPIAQAILDAARERGIVIPQLEDARYEVGYGIQARVGARLVRVGSERYMTMENIPLAADFLAARRDTQSRGASIVYVAFEDKLAGAIELLPTVRREAREVIAALKELGLTLCIISGDQAAPTEALASEL